MGRLTLDDYNSQKLEMATSGATKLLGIGKFTPQRTPFVGALVVLSPNHTAADLEDAGYEVSSDLGSVAVVRVSIDQVEELAELDAVRTLDFGRKGQLFMNRARKYLGVDQLHSGFTFNGVTETYTGKGVVTGIYDTGVMPNHINFLDADGNQRVQRLWHYYTEENESGEEEGWIESCETPDAVASFETDDNTESHGTHTTGIMAGGYKGTTILVDYDEDIKDFNYGEDKPNPFYGVATESTIAIGCGELDDAFVIDGMTRIVDYAKSEGMPVVINYSAGSSIGPHDGTDAFSQALSTLAKDAVICVAAGNSGDTNMSMEINGGTTIKTFAEKDASAGVTVGYLDIWSDTSEPFDVTLFAYTKSFIGSAKETDMLTISSPTSSVQSVNNTNTAFKNAFSAGSIAAMSEVDKNNNRYHVLSLIQVQPKSGFTTGKLGVKITTKSGQKVNAYFNGYGSLESSSVSGYTAGNSANSISNESCCPDVISVGAYTSRTLWGRLDGNAYGYNDNSGFSLGSLAPFSSYGKAFDGTQLPDITAPGANVISSYSTPYIKGGTVEADSVGAMSAGVNSAGTTHLWGPMQGTSMAAPCVSGRVALWLQADPDLTVWDIKEIMKQTATQDEATKTDPTRWGAGKINAVAGLEEILRRKSLMSIGEIKTSPEENVIITQGHGSIDIFAAGETAFRATLCTIAGMTVRSITSSGDKCSFSTSDISAGIYIISVDTAAGRVSRMIMIK